MFLCIIHSHGMTPWKGQHSTLHSTSPDMSWFIPFLVGILAIYLVSRLIPRSKVDIKGKYVLITGCDAGFGRMTAIRLDKMGVYVLAACLTKEGEQSLKSVTSNKLMTLQMDVTNSKQIKEICEEVERRIPSDTGKLVSDIPTIPAFWLWILSTAGKRTIVSVKYFNLKGVQFRIGRRQKLEGSLCIYWSRHNIKMEM